ncbi:hypothetical protein [Spirosoma foliorum]|uniref:Beta-lactamase-related domain-containing protein n=1 Tax=Spirosoma foliorum TaxID=2710596 RepID=A0A7G5GUF0_9BACT|nr:hypothetical protein [Spirosoma foliorum]QMW02492.1 hypothetical protein H3H32_32060 [Spirosoma foliorum]
MTHQLPTRAYPAIQAVLNSHNGVTGYAQYANGYTRDCLFETRSAFKSVTSLLTGIAINIHQIDSTILFVYLS